MSAGGGVLARLAALEHEIRTLRLRVTSEQGGGVPAAPHATEHYDGGDDEVDVTQLGGFPGGSPRTYLDSNAEFTDPGGGADAFGRVAVSGQSDVVADQPGDTLTLVAGSNVTLTTTPGTDSVTIAASGGGGGDSTTADTQANIPATTNDGNLFFPTNGLYVWRDNGSALVPWGPIYPMTKPVDGDFAWINQGSASVDTTNGGIYLSTPAAAGVDIKIRKKAAPSTPYTITAAFLYEGLFATLQQFGLCFRQSSDGKLHNFAIHRNGSQLVIASYQYTNPTTFSASYTSAFFTTPTPIWMRIADNGTNRICSYSCDGHHWQVFHTVSRTDFLTADEVGFYVSAENASFGIGVTLLSWAEA